MAEVAPTRDPRWGDRDRAGKGAAIFRSVEQVADFDVRAATWLDIGCGSGGIAAAIAPHVKRMIGVDPEPWPRWREATVSAPNLGFHVAGYRDLESLLGPESIDVVICNQVYEHVDDPAALLDAIAAVMTRDGCCYFAGPNLLWPIEPHVFWPFVHWLPRRFAQRAMTALGSRRARDLDAFSWPYWRLVRQFRASGFDYRSILVERLRAAGGGGSDAARRGHSRLGFAEALAPIAPGFVFLLTRRRG